MPTLPQPTEAEWQEQVIELARLYGWEVMHVRRSRGRGQQWTTSTSVSGWPDLFCWHPAWKRVAAIELKSRCGSLTPEQRAVLDSMDAAGVETYVLRPADFDQARWLLGKPDAPELLRRITDASHS